MNAPSKEVNSDTIVASIYIAGDVAQARQICREYCEQVGLCVTVEPLDFIYTGGLESGVRVGLINYPRFPSTVRDIKETAISLGDKLRVGMFQHSYSVVMSDKTIWRSWRKED